MMKHTALLPLLCLLALLRPLSIRATDHFVSFGPEGFVWIQAGRVLPILVDEGEHKGVTRAVANLQADAESVTGVRPTLLHALSGTDSNSCARRLLIIGSLDRSTYIQQLVKAGRLPADELQGKREKFILTTIENPLEGVDAAVVIAGSDKRGTIYGIYELTRQMGVSPWAYWADVPITRHETVGIMPGSYTDGEPAVEYRGIFLNDEWPSLGGWAQETFGGFNSRFYEKVFELILRLKGNFMWPAMWASAFYDDDPANGPLADEMGIVMGTSHHEPMGLAQQDWKRRGTGAWDYTKNGAVLRDFWTSGMERCRDWESVITVGMRGDGDEPMSEDANISLLQNIVRDQRKIIAKVTGRKASETPQVWALYKEVQDYYDKGMRVPDDVTLLLCDDNWGNVRKLPALTAKPRKGGYGMYYHFDYVGAPRNSKWVNITQIQRTWEQMNLCYEYGVRKLWVVNVGDLKPMEYPISFFLDMAWDPRRFNETNLHQHTVDWCAQQFGEAYAGEAARIIGLYTQYNRRITAEELNKDTYSLHNHNEWERVMSDYRQLNLDALRLYHLLPAAYRDAFDQLVLFPVQACANLYEMYYAAAMNHDLADRGDAEANLWADRVAASYARDSVLTHYYNHVISGGKWNHMMDQTHIGYTYWQQPDVQVMPDVVRLPEPSPDIPVFAETDGYVSIEAEHFTRSSEGADIRWIIIPGLGRTLSAVTTMPCTASPDTETYLEYDIDTQSAGEAKVTVRLSTTLNWNDTGLRYALSVDGNEEVVVNFNGHYRGELAEWQRDHVIDSVVTLDFGQPGTHHLRFRPLDPTIVLQKLLLDFEGLKPSYLGPPETIKAK